MLQLYPFIGRRQASARPGQAAQALTAPSAQRPAPSAPSGSGAPARPPALYNSSALASALASSAHRRGIPPGSAKWTWTWTWTVRRFDESDLRQRTSGDGRAPGLVRRRGPVRPAGLGAERCFGFSGGGARDGRVTCICLLIVQKTSCIIALNLLLQSSLTFIITTCKVFS